MKKIVVLVVVLTLVLLSASVVIAHEGEVHGCHWESGRAFGQHVAEHARSGHLGVEHNPGMHQGYSLCVP